MLAQCIGLLGWRGLEQGLALLKQIASRVYRIRALGGSALELCFVAEGKFDFVIDGHLSIWDVAAALLIVQEAGGKTTDWSGEPMSPASTQIVASNGKIHEELLKRFRA